MQIRISHRVYTRARVCTHTHTLPFSPLHFMLRPNCLFLFLDPVMFLFAFNCIPHYSFSFAFCCFVRETFLYSHKLYYIPLTIL